MWVMVSLDKSVFREVVRTVWSGAIPKRDQEKNRWSEHGASLRSFTFQGSGGANSREGLWVRAPGPPTNNSRVKGWGCNSQRCQARRVSLPLWLVKQLFICCWE